MLGWSLFQSNIRALFGVFFFPICLPAIKKLPNSFFFFFFLLFVKLYSWPATQSPTFIIEIFMYIMDTSIFLELLNMSLSCQQCKLMMIISFSNESMFHFSHDCDCFTKTVIVFLLHVFQIVLYQKC